MALRHDAQGFLVGDPIEIGRALATWDAIRADVRAIRQAIANPVLVRSGTQRGAGARQQATAVIPLRAATPAGRAGAATNSAGRAATSAAIAVPAGRDARAAVRTGAAVAERAARTARPTPTAQPAGRDARGRFTAGAAEAAEAATKTSRAAGAVASAAGRIAGALTHPGSLEEADPAVKAAAEIARPLARGYGMLGGGEKRQEGWLRRIYATLTGFRKEETAYSKAAQNSLRAIEEKPGAAGGAADGGGGLLSRLLPSLPGGGLLSGAGSLLGGAARKAGGLLRRIPLLRSLFAIGGAASDIFDSEGDDTLSRRDKDARAGKAVGGAAGSIGGTFAGAKLGVLAGAFAGPIGAAIGGVVGGVAGAFFGDQAGQILGDTVGGWVADLREADIAGFIADTWQRTVDGFKGAWESVTKFCGGFVESAKAGWDKITGLFTAAWEGLKALPVIGPAIQKAAEAASTTAAAAKEKVAEVAAKAGEKTAEVAAVVGEKAKQAGEFIAKETTLGKAATAAGQWVLGQTSKLFESGRGGAGTVSTGKGDLGGASYGTYQLSSKQGTLQQFLKQSGYAEQFAGLQPGTPEFNAKWKQIAQSDAGFEGTQHDFIKATHYDPALAALKGAGIDLSGRGAAVQDVLWSTSVQFGAGDAKKGAAAMFQNALAGKDIASMSDAEIVAAIQDYKIANNEQLFASSSAAVRTGTLARAGDEKARLLSLAGTSPMVSIASAPPVNLPAPQTFAEAPAIAETLATGGGAGRDTIKVTVDKPEAEQDVRDRRIAHIVTGGLSAT